MKKSQANNYIFHLTNTMDFADETKTAIHSYLDELFTSMSKDYLEAYKYYITTYKLLRDSESASDYERLRMNMETSAKVSEYIENRLQMLIMMLKSYDEELS